ncbi:hypothetical protein AOC05_11655 [Arthrobacter alpinus]|uniref:ABC transporter domain-containing protein n=1 Tax=Arthrobacter alpinus TaxID=656366 RepID=A0A0M4QNC1_9MICC|nr:ATP-binding cassette domain-containing protein [Arthrobacter alpinus]ALE92797.1 hypothetical protein AOC05_11655 [Arthrobacter alpinus]
MVDGVNLPVERGKIFGRLGSNGAGKTTTLKDIEGVLKLKSSILLPPHSMEDNPQVVALAHGALTLEGAFTGLTESEIRD